MSKWLLCMCNGFGEPASKKLPCKQSSLTTRQKWEEGESLSPSCYFLVLISSLFLPHFFVSPFLSFPLISHFLPRRNENEEITGRRETLIFASLWETSANREARNLITHYLKISHLQYGADPSVNCEFIVLHVEMICFPYRQPLLYI